MKIVTLCLSVLLLSGIAQASDVEFGYQLGQKLKSLGQCSRVKLTRKKEAWALAHLMEEKVLQVSTDYSVTSNNKVFSKFQPLSAPFFKSQTVTAYFQSQDLCEQYKKQMEAFLQ